MKPKETTKHRGYGYQHKKRRRMYARIVAAGQAHCARCGGFIYPEEPFDLDHTPDRTGYLGVSHVRCNRATAKGRKRRRGWRASRRW